MSLYSHYRLVYLYLRGKLHLLACALHTVLMININQNNVFTHGNYTIECKIAKFTAMHFSTNCAVRIWFQCQWFLNYKQRLTFGNNNNNNNNLCYNTIQKEK